MITEHCLKQTYFFNGSRGRSFKAAARGSKRTIPIWRCLSLSTVMLSREVRELSWIVQHSLAVFLLPGFSRSWTALLLSTSHERNGTTVTTAPRTPFSALLFFLKRGTVDKQSATFKPLFWRSWPFLYPTYWLAGSSPNPLLGQTAALCWLSHLLCGWHGVSLEHLTGGKWNEQHYRNLEGKAACQNGCFNVIIADGKSNCLGNVEYFSFQGWLRGESTWVWISCWSVYPATAALQILFKSNWSDTLTWQTILYRSVQCMLI